MIQERIFELIEAKKYFELRGFLAGQLSADIAEVLEETEAKMTRLLFRMLSKEHAADVFAFLSPEVQSNIYNMVDEKEIQEILDELQFDDMIDFLEEMPANIVKKILSKTPEHERKLINQFLHYPEYSAGSLMTIEFVALKKEMTAAEALKKIKATAADKETIYTCYATSMSRELEGTVSLEKLVLAPEDKTIEGILKKECLSVNTHDDQEVVAELFKKYDLLAMPVVDHENRLVGIITIDDIVDVIEEENTEDIYRMAALTTSDGDYLSTGVFELARKRVLWLMILMVSATLSAAVVTKYQSLIEAVVSLATFMPMIMGTGGNAGAQTSAIIIRSLALGELASGDILRIIWKELRVSMMVGVCLAGINFLRLIFLSGASLQMAVTVSSALIGTVIFAKLMGSMLPLLADKIKIDPALMASPLITTIVDATSLTIYFLIAKQVFQL